MNPAFTIESGASEKRRPGLRFFEMGTPKGIKILVLALLVVGLLGMSKEKRSNLVTLFMCGDVMIGRGIDQVLPRPGDPTLYESYMKSARGYVEIGERRTGPISKPVDFSYIWGDALEELKKVSPDLRIINLETAITTRDDYWLRDTLNREGEKFGPLVESREDNTLILRWRD